MSARTNIASYLSDQARSRPHAPAIFMPCGRGPEGRVRYVHLTYAQLDRASDEVAHGLTAIGLGRGVRTALMVKPSLPFFPLVFGMFKAGTVPVMVDPGMGIAPLAKCLAEAAPEGFIGIPPAHIARLVLGWARGSLKTLVTVGPRLLWGGHTLAQVRALGVKALEAKSALPQTAPDDLAALLFTSGSTGIPKGVEYRQRHFLAQVKALLATYSFRAGDLDLPTFPLFALFDPALGLTTVVPDMDFTKPAKVNAALLVEALEDFGIGTMFGSPALLDTLGRHCRAHGLKLPTLNRVITAGAPVSNRILEQLAEALPESAEIVTPYGATECLPVASIDHRARLSTTRQATAEGRGVCVGVPVPSIDLRVIRIDDGALPEWSDGLELPRGEVGEITVAGEQATERYWARDEQTALAKLRHADGRIRHRMGDLGWLDEQGRLWFCGRKSERVRTGQGVMFTAQVEGVFEAHPLVKRSALIGLGAAGAQEPVLCVELLDGGPGSPALIAELLALGAAQAVSAPVKRVLFHPAFPVDIRHNAKIHRTTLAAWAQEQRA